MACYSWSVEPRDYLPESWINPTVRLYKHTFMLIILAQGDVHFACCGTGSRPRPTLKFNHSPSSLERPWLSPSQQQHARPSAKQTTLLSASLSSLAILGDARASYPAISPLRAATCPEKSYCGHQRAPTFHGGQNGGSSPGQSFTSPHSLSVPWTHPVTAMAVTKLTLPTATWRNRA